MRLTVVHPSFRTALRPVCVPFSPVARAKPLSPNNFLFGDKVEFYVAISKWRQPMQWWVRDWRAAGVLPIETKQGMILLYGGAERPFSFVPTAA